MFVTSEKRWSQRDPLRLGSDLNRLQLWSRSHCGQSIRAFDSGSMSRCGGKLSQLVKRSLPPLSPQHRRPASAVPRRLIQLFTPRFPSDQCQPTTLPCVIPPSVFLVSWIIDLSLFLTWIFLPSPFSDLLLVYFCQSTLCQ